MSVKDAKKIDQLAKALLALKTADEAQRFMRDLLTDAEITEFSNRFCAAEMLQSGLPYSAVERETGLSSTTVARVSKWLNTGKDGYKTVIARLKKTASATTKSHHHTVPQVGKGLVLRKRSSA